MFRLECIATFEETVRKSRFLATAVPVASEEEARRAIAAHSIPDANHNCWAWRLGQGYRFSDDGEPGGTAGKPILAAIDGREIDGVAVVVTRWFGGVLLGTGGLVRAYGGTAAACLRAAPLTPVVTVVEGTIGVAFSDLALVKARLSAFEGVRIAAEDFSGTGATLTVLVPAGERDAVAALVADLTSGRSRLAVPD